MGFVKTPESISVCTRYRVSVYGPINSLRSNWRIVVKLIRSLHVCALYFCDTNKSNWQPSEIVKFQLSEHSGRISFGSCVKALLIECKTTINKHKNKNFIHFSYLYRICFKTRIKLKNIFFTKQQLLHIGLLGCYVLPTGKWSLTFRESVLPQSKDRMVNLD